MVLFFGKVFLKKYVESLLTTLIGTKGGLLVDTLNY